MLSDDLYTGPQHARTVREQILDAAYFFVSRAREIDGVRRIALLGSITTSKPSPKDLDLLVWLPDDLGLEALAALSRRTLGRVNQTGNRRGCDVFVADVANRYLGRICMWRTCEPYVRQSCFAEHCGRRKFLKDDLQDIALSATLIHAPPVGVWPSIVLRREVPSDVRRFLHRLDADRSERPAVRRSSVDWPNIPA